MTTKPKRQKPRLDAQPERQPLTLVRLPDDALIAYAKILHRVAMKKAERQRGELAHAA